jgi:hypothetical protein
MLANDLNRYWPEPDITEGSSSNLDILLNGTFDRTSFPGDALPMIVYGLPDANYAPADPVREWNPYYGAAGYQFEDRTIADQSVNMPYPSVGMNPWDYVYGGIRADDGILAVRARFMESQEGLVSLS